MTSTTPLAPTTGPSPRFSLTDPTTLYGIASMAAVVASLAAGAPLAVQLGMIGHLIAYVLAAVPAKHDLQATAIALAQSVPQVMNILGTALPADVATAVIAAPAEPAPAVAAEVTVDSTPATPVADPAPPAATIPVVLTPVVSVPSAAVWNVVGADGAIVGTVDPSDPNIHPTGA